MIAPADPKQRHSSSQSWVVSPFADRQRIRNTPGLPTPLTALLLGGALLAGACESDEQLSASQYRPPGTSDCTGAYTPNSTVCWNGEDAGEGPITQNRAEAEENGARPRGDRCNGRIIRAPGTEGTLSVSFNTKRLGGRYAPFNCGAVWIEDSDGFYIRTLNMWAGERRSAVVAWTLSVCDQDALITRPDVTTSATLNKPQAHSTTWDTKDFRGLVTPDGVYSLWMQVTEDEYPEGPFMQINFVKGSESFTSMPKPARGYENITLNYTPSGSAANAP